MADKLKPQLIHEFLKLRQKVGELELYRTESLRTFEYLMKFRQLFSELPDLVYFCDKEGTILYANETFEKFTGHPLDELHVGPFAPLFEDENFQKAFTVTLKGERPQGEVYFKDTRIISEFKNIPMRDDAGRIIGVMGIARDITSRRKVEHELTNYIHVLEEMIHSQIDEIKTLKTALKEKIASGERLELEFKEYEVKYLNLIEAVSDPVAVVGSDGYICYINRRTSELTGIPADELVGKHLVRLFPKGDAEFYAKAYKDFINNGVPFPKISLQMQHRGGRKIPVDLTCIPTEVNGKKLVQIIFRDMSGSRKTELELKKLYAIIEQSPSAVSITDINGVIEYVNPAFERMTGFSLGETSGRHIKTFSTAVPPEAHDDLWLTVLEGAPWRGTFKTVTKDGGELYLRAFVEPIKTNDGEITSLVSVQDKLPANVHRKATGH
ncbi:MAG: PAS domain S-box protein [Deltaproteobacteria bacterium]|nr:PAS domain S-box protein [Deltaproteobacteria bacterium]